MVTTRQEAGSSRTTQRSRAARAYRNGQLVCARVELIVRPDTRIGLAPHERRHLAARFQDGLHPALRTDLLELVRRRGAAARRAAERIEPIEVVVTDGPLGTQLIIGRIEPPQLRRGALRTIEFGLREQEPTR
ncbi:MAG: hypothetical protein ACRDLN_03300 [Solirubrobacteraceae bacterium]